MANARAKVQALDFSNVKESSGINPKHVEAGEYLARITEVIDAPAKDGTAMWCFIVQLDDMRSATYPFYCKLQENQLWKLRNLFIAAGKGKLVSGKKRVNVDPNAVIGAQVGIVLEDDEYEGKMKSVIESLMPAADLEQDDDATPEDPDVDDDEDGEEEAPVTKKARAKVAEAVEDDLEDDDEEEPEEVPAPKKKRKPAPEPEPEDDDDDDEEEEEPEEKPVSKRTTARRKAKAEAEAAAAAASEEEDEDDEEEEPPAPKAKKKRKAAPVVEDDDDDDELDLSELDDED